jgi:glycosyltransferase involved in cell wall biosynthesis
MSQSSDISITALIAVYNGADLIRRSIDSVIAQSSPATEFIVVDDGSTDSTAEIIRSYGPQVRYVHQDNRGVAAARNRGISLATSDWVAFLDHDDEWLPNKLERQRACLLANLSAAICYSGLWYHDIEGKTAFKYRPVSDLWPSARLRNPFAPSVAVIRKEALLAVGGFDESLKGASCEDWDLFVRLLTRYPVVAVPEALTHYYEIGTGGSRNYKRMLPNTLSIVDKSLLCGLSGLNRAWWRRRIVATLYYRAAISAREWGDPATEFLWQSICTWPFPDRRIKTLFVEMLESVHLRKRGDRCA